MSKAEKEIKSLKDGTTGDVNVGVAFSPRIHLLPMATINVQNKFPNIYFKVFAGQRMDLLSDLLKGRIDLFVSAIVPDDILFLEIS